MADDLTGITLDEVAAEEAELHFTQFDYDDAWRLGSMLVGTAQSRNLPIAIDITRGGQQLFHAALTGSTPDNDAWIARKIRAVMQFGRSSLYLSLECKRDGRSLAESRGVDPRLFVAAGGSFPIHIDGAGIIGTVTVSGLPQVDDHKFVVETIRRFLAPASATAVLAPAQE
jgi:uncharacterized protein (UPF0303 family)